MKLLHCNDNLDRNHDDHSAPPLVEIVKGETGDCLRLQLPEGEIVFVREGRFRLSFDEVENQLVVGGQFFLFPAGSVVKAFFEETSHLLICRIKHPIEICNRYSIDDLYKEETVQKEEFTLLRFNERIRQFVDNLMACMEDERWCNFYFEAKIQEMYHLLHAYYPREQLKRFFLPLMNSNTAFSSFVLMHYTEVKNVKEFAARAGYSLSGFGKRFRQVFGVSPSFWLRQRKAQRIYHEIKTSTKSFKELCQEYDFSSLSHFNDFCKKIFGVPPGKIRGKNNT